MRLLLQLYSCQRYNTRKCWTGFQQQEQEKDSFLAGMIGEGWKAIEGVYSNVSVIIHFLPSRSSMTRSNYLFPFPPSTPLPFWLPGVVQEIEGAFRNIEKSKESRLYIRQHDKWHNFYHFGISHQRYIIWWLFLKCVSYPAYLMALRF